MIHYYSTKQQAPQVDFATALFQGLAPDGGLYFPTHFPTFTAVEMRALHGATLPEVGFRVLQKWFGAEIAHDAVRDLAYAAQNFPIELRSVGPYHILELFHGPTKAFKDVAAQNLSRLMSHFLQQESKQVTLLVATSGDTGGAIAHGFADIPNIEVYVLFPHGRVSRLQEQQLTRVAPNVHPLEIEGVFDDCQALVKRAFNDPDLASLNLTSANSISIGRLIPQIIYYVYAYAQRPQDNLAFVVPSGNFGNLTAGLFARAMGLPFQRFVAATNANDTAVRYARTGRYEPHDTIPTLSNAMDVGNPSNFVRVLELFGHSHEQFGQTLRAHAATDAETVQTMQQVYDRFDYVLDPHTAVGWHVAATHPADLEGFDPILVATADPLKFAQEIEAASGIQLDNRAALAPLQHRAPRKTALPNEYEVLKAHLLR